MLITVNPSGQLTFQVDPLVQPYDGEEDVLVGVINRSGATVFGIQLLGNGIFGFDGDGAKGGDYAGPATSFTVQDANSGTVNFDDGLENNGFLWFSLEGRQSFADQACQHHHDRPGARICLRQGCRQKVGTVGATDFPATNPPAGRMHEDDLALDIARQLQGKLGAAGYQVTMTKTDANSCPKLLERASEANKAKSNMFVSIHPYEGRDAIVISTQDDPDDFKDD